VQITRAGKGTLTLENPVMPASGTLGFAEEYKGFVKLDKLGAFVTNPVTLDLRNPAHGTRVVALDAGVLVHSGLPNQGLEKTLAAFSAKWRKLPVPVILHLVAASEDELRRALEHINDEDSITAVELGISDDAAPADAKLLVRAAIDQAEKPVIARVPFQEAVAYARACSDAGADALTVCAPPRGTARDAGGRLVSGRVYSPLVKPMVLRLVGQIARSARVPIIGAGGIHSPQDARDFLEAGAVAVQVDSVTWVKPQMLEVIARDLGGLVLTQPIGALADEWHEGMGQTERNQKLPPDERTVIPKPKPK
jgi:dihydroorotate dehydrogenase (NAD+) catalytic subunit